MMALLRATPSRIRRAAPSAPIILKKYFDFPWTGPGQTTLTLTPNASASIRREYDRLTTAALVAP